MASPEVGNALLKTDIVGGLRLNEAQAIQAKWEIDTGIHRTPAGRVERMGEEFVELGEAVGRLEEADTLEHRTEAAKEAIDVIILALAVIDSLGFDAERLFTDKMTRNYKKYPPVEIQRLSSDKGWSPEQCLLYLKSIWDEDRQTHIIFDSQSEENSQNSV